MILSCLDSRVPMVWRCRRLTRLPTVRLPLTHALETGTHVLGRQQLQQDIQHLMVPVGKNVPNLAHSRVVSAPPRSTMSAG